MDDYFTNLEYHDVVSKVLEKYGPLADQTYRDFGFVFGEHPIKTAMIDMFWSLQYIQRQTKCRIEKYERWMEEDYQQHLAEMKEIAHETH